MLFIDGPFTTLLTTIFLSSSFELPALSYTLIVYEPDPELFSNRPFSRATSSVLPLLMLTILSTPESESEALNVILSVALVLTR